MILIAVPQEDAVIHRHAQLQHRRQRLRNVRNLAQKQVRTQVVHNRNADRSQKDERHQPRIHTETQRNRRQQHSHRNIDRRLTVRKVLRIYKHRTHTGQIALLIADGPDLAYRRHRTVFRSTFIKQNQKHRTVAAVERLVHLIRQKFPRNIDARHIIPPDHGLYMVHVRNLFLQLHDILIVHALDDIHGEGTGPKLILQDVLTLHRLNILRKIREHIVVDLRMRVADRCRYQKNQRRYQDGYVQLHYPFAKFFRHQTPSNEN